MTAVTDATAAPDVKQATLGSPAPAAPLPPLSLYLHFPWCVAKCPYCDFNSFTLHGALPVRDYIDALLVDLEAQLRTVPARAVASVFLGGGTPSLFPPEAIARLFDGVRRLLPFGPDVEVTLEANPGTIERGRFAGYRDAGINRVSLGAQSFDATRLKALGRIHSPDETRRAAEELHSAGLSNFNLDLMFALPGQDATAAVADLHAALALQPAHLSWYQLTLEPGTVFAALPPVLPDDDAAWEIQAAGFDVLAAAGFARYEVSAFARPGRQAAHNLNYWRFGDYLGVGAGAHGKATLALPGRVLRSTRAREPRRYLADPAADPGWTSVPRDQLPFEFLINALRLVDGFGAAEFEAATGLPFAYIEPGLQAQAQRGLIELDRGRCRASPTGFSFLNDVVAAFLPSADACQPVTAQHPG
jgi:putative oxygen-independent coproporphyrinogen III oxidase